jgi:sirohydrochlorin ferrochelatase
MYEPAALSDKHGRAQSSGQPMRAILLVDHGSRAAEANESLAVVAGLVRERVGPDVVVAHAHMEIAPPTVPETVAELVERGVREITVVPYFLAPGRHSREDIPRLTSDATIAHPGVLFVVAEPLGPHPLLAELVMLRSGG